MILTKLPKLVMFDLDGTLADTIPQLHLAVLAALKKVHKPPVTIEQTRTYVGNGPMLLVARAMLVDKDATLEKVDATLLQQAREEFNRSYALNCDCSQSIFPYVRETLAFLKQKQVQLAVVTNKPHRFVIPMLQQANLAEYFAGVLGSEVIPEKKPDPTPLFYMCQKLGVEPQDAVMVGDSYNDIEAAHNAKMISIALTCGYNRGRDIRDSNPDYVFDNFKEIYDLMRSLNKD